MQLERAVQVEEKRISANDRAYNEIVDLILTGQLRPGERTSVKTLSGRLGIGRTPTKEAITRLEMEGVFAVAERSGTTLKEIDKVGAEHIFALRRVLEDFAAEGAVKNVTSSCLSKLYYYLEEMRESSLAPMGRWRSPSRFVRANAAFHAVIVAAAGNPFLDRLYGQLQLQLQIVTYLIRKGVTEEAAELRFEEHKAILSALERRDTELLKTLLRKHTKTTEDTVAEVSMYR